MTTLEDLLKLGKTLSESGVKYVLIGGWAVILHGLGRTTVDIDIIVENSDENIKNLKNALRKFIKEEEIGELTSEMMKEYQVIRVGLGDFYVDIITKIGDIDYGEASGDVVREIIDDVSIPVAGIDTMIELKKGIREIDIKDRIFLEGKKEFQENKRQK
jgi:hypothetical protein